MSQVNALPVSTPPVRVHTPRPTATPLMDEAIGRVRENARRFALLSLDQRAALARAMQVGYLRVAAETVKAACAAKGVSLGSPLEGEEWSLGPCSSCGICA